MAGKDEKKSIWLGMAFVLAAGLLIGFFSHSITSPVAANFASKNIDEQRLEWVGEADAIRGSLGEGYNCCLEKPCWYCIQKTPGHGEVARCECRQNILDGEHPCGECIGEILEGHGLPELAPYYAKAIAHKVGEQHLENLKAIIADMYGISVEEQVS